MSSDKKVMLVKCLNEARRDVYSFKQIPLGIAYLAAVLKERCNVVVFDMLVDDDLMGTLRREQPDIIGLSIFSVDFIFVRPLISLMREEFPNALIVAGGAHATTEPRHVLDCGVDLIVRGEGERAFVEIVDSYKGDVKDLEGISNVTFMRSGILVNRNVQVVKRIDDIPMPAFEVFDRKKYTQYPIMTSRGCPFSCKYCATKTIWGNGVRFHSAERVMKEIERAVFEYDVHKLVFIDDTFTLKHSRLFKLCEMIVSAGYYDLDWSVNSRVDTMNDAVAGALSRAGCKVVSFGIETGSEFLQERVSKNIKISQMKKAIQACRNHGIRVKTGWMVGLPPGGYDEQMKSLDVMLELSPDEISIHHFIPMPGTPYWKDPNLFGIEFNKKQLLENFSIDSLPGELGLKFNYISEEELIAVITKIVDVLRQHGYKQPHEISEAYSIGTRVVNTYMDKGRLSVLPY